MKKNNAWKSVMVSLFWILISLGISVALYEVATKLMSYSDTLMFVLGIICLLIAITLSVGVIDIQILKIKFAYRKMPTKQTEVKDPLSSPIVEREYKSENQEK